MSVKCLHHSGLLTDHCHSYVPLQVSNNQHRDVLWTDDHYVCDGLEDLGLHLSYHFVSLVDVPNLYFSFQVSTYQVVLVFPHAADSSRVGIHVVDPHGVHIEACQSSILQPAD